MWAACTARVPSCWLLQYALPLRRNTRSGGVVGHRMGHLKSHAGGAFSAAWLGGGGTCWIARQPNRGGVGWHACRWRYVAVPGRVRTCDSTQQGPHAWQYAAGSAHAVPVRSRVRLCGGGSGGSMWQAAGLRTSCTSQRRSPSSALHCHDYCGV